jgi:hypothetical protein
MICPFFDFGCHKKTKKNQRDKVNVELNMGDTTKKCVLLNIVSSFFFFSESGISGTSFHQMAAIQSQKSRLFSVLKV